MAKLITPRSEDYSRWYTDVVVHAKLADYSPVKGCMVIRPHGYALWENMQKALDRMFKETGHENAYFPLFIPESFLRKEQEHVEGFAPECAVVTHAGGTKLEEPLVIRPTSETIMYAMYAKWIQSYRDLPMLINQWANVVRWEMRTRLFLRTTEFLWQEGHTAHASYDEAEKEVLKILDVYRIFAEEYMAMPVIKGIKTDKEKFAGAMRTYCIEALMQDNRSLQAGTSHNLGQNFSRAFDVKFQNKNGEWEYVWQTSWGVSTRLIGAVVMAHGDDNGLVLPPRIAPAQVVVVPIWKNDEEKTRAMEVIEKLKTILQPLGLSMKYDVRTEVNPGWKFHEWELAGVPLRLELGPKEVVASEVMTVRRLNRVREKIRMDHLPGRLPELLKEIQQEMFDAALKRREENTFRIDDWQSFRRHIVEKGGFIFSGWCGSRDCEEKIQEETKATIRCIPIDAENESGKCVWCGGDSPRRVCFAKAY
ncbi:MAG: proline--tRNA ligase [Acidobacteriota bacterium]